VFCVGSQRVFFKRPQTHDLGLEEVSRLRKFLKEAGPSSQAEEPAQPSRMIVYSGRERRVSRTGGGEPGTGAGVGKALPGSAHSYAGSGCHHHREPKAGSAVDL
jgi:hypothetical protein